MDLEKEVIAARIIKQRLQMISDALSPDFLHCLENYNYRFSVPLGNDNFLEVRVSIMKIYRGSNDDDMEEESFP